MDQMEKRIRSRASQKTMYINIENFNNIINGIEILNGFMNSQRKKNIKEYFINIKLRINFMKVGPILNIENYIKI